MFFEYPRPLMFFLRLWKPIGKWTSRLAVFASALSLVMVFSTFRFDPATQSAEALVWLDLVGAFFLTSTGLFLTSAVVNGLVRLFDKLEEKAKRHASMTLEPITQALNKFGFEAVFCLQFDTSNPALDWRVNTSLFGDLDKGKQIDVCDHDGVLLLSFTLWVHNFHIAHLAMDRFFTQTPGGLKFNQILADRLIADLLPVLKTPSPAAHPSTDVAPAPVQGLGPLARHLRPVLDVLHGLGQDVHEKAQPALASFRATCARLDAATRTMAAGDPSLAVFEDSLLPRLHKVLADAAPFLKGADAGDPTLVPLVASLDAWAVHAAKAVDALRDARLTGVVAAANLQLAVSTIADPVHA